MKHPYTLIAWSMLSFFPVFSQVVTVGEGKIESTESSSPFPTLFQDARHAFIYTAKELRREGADGGMVTSLGFQIRESSSQDIDRLVVRIGHAGAGEYAYETVFSEDLQEVFSGAYRVEGEGWQMIRLHHPFLWNGKDPIEIEISYDNVAYSTNTVVQCSREKSAHRTLFNYADNASGPELHALGSTDIRPNIRLEFDGELNAGIGKE